MHKVVAFARFLLTFLTMFGILLLWGGFIIAFLVFAHH